MVWRKPGPRSVRRSGLRNTVRLSRRNGTNGTDVQGNHGQRGRDRSGYPKRKRIVVRRWGRAFRYKPLPPRPRGPARAEGETAMGWAIKLVDKMPTPAIRLTWSPQPPPKPPPGRECAGKTWA